MGLVAVKKTIPEFAIQQFVKINVLTEQIDVFIGIDFNKLALTKLVENRL